MREKRIYTATEFIYTIMKERGETEERIHDYYAFKLPRIMPLYAMEELSDLEYFSDDGWKKISKITNDIDYRFSDDEVLGNGFIEFLELWIDENNYHIMDINNPSEIRGKWEIFYDENSDKFIKYKSENGLYKDLLNFYSKYLLWGK